MSFLNLSGCFVRCELHSVRQAAALQWVEYSKVYAESYWRVMLRVYYCNMWLNPSLEFNVAPLKMSDELVSKSNAGDLLDNVLKFILILHICTLQWEILWCWCTDMLSYRHFGYMWMHLLKHLLLDNQTPLKANHTFLVFSCRLIACADLYMTNFDKILILAYNDTVPYEHLHLFGKFLPGEKDFVIFIF